MSWPRSSGPRFTPTTVRADGHYVGVSMWPAADGRRIHLCLRQPVIAVALGTLLLSERLILTTVLGGAIVLASVALLLLHRSRTAA